MSLIGLMCKRGDTFSLQVLIGRGLFLLLHLTEFSLSISFLYSVSNFLLKFGKNHLTNGYVYDIIYKRCKCTISSVGRATDS